VKTYSGFKVWLHPFGTYGIRLRWVVSFMLIPGKRAESDLQPVNAWWRTATFTHTGNWTRFSDLRSRSRHCTDWLYLIFFLFSSTLQFLLSYNFISQVVNLIFLMSCGHSTSIISSSWHKYSFPETLKEIRQDLMSSRLIIQPNFPLNSCFFFRFRLIFRQLKVIQHWFSLYILETVIIVFIRFPF
jgi:hypothetical protein